VLTYAQFTATETTRENTINDDTGHLRLRCGRHVLADSPVISCAHDTAARVNQRNAFIACEVRSQPAVSVLYWVIDHNATTLVVGQIVREYWTLVLVSRRFTPSL